MVINESKINNIMGDLENTSGIKLNNHRRKLKQRFDIIKKLGQGTYGKVQLGVNKETGEQVAIKTIKKCMIETEADLIRIRREIQIMLSVQHPYIIHIYEVFENREKIILVMEHASGGELYDYLFEKKVLEEEESRRIFRQIAMAVYYCHKHKICHRDLKLENILLDEYGNAKIADFGLSNIFNGKQLLSTFCGSPLYASPEIVNGTPYNGPEVDCWSLGVLLYTLVYGAMPFDGSHFKRLVKQISKGYFFEPSDPSSASGLIHEMLTVSAEKRANIETICSHWWINETYNESCLELAEKYSNETPVRLDLLLSLVPPPTKGTDNIVIPDEMDSSKIAQVEHEPLNGKLNKSQSDSNISVASIEWSSKNGPKRKLELSLVDAGEDETDGQALTEDDDRNESSRKMSQSEISASMDTTKMPQLQTSATFVIKSNSNSNSDSQQNGCLQPEVENSRWESNVQSSKLPNDNRDDSVDPQTVPCDFADSVATTTYAPLTTTATTTSSTSPITTNATSANNKGLVKKRFLIKKKTIPATGSANNGIESKLPCPARPLSSLSDRRSSKIFETAERFQNLLLENQQNRTSIPALKKFSIPGIVNVGGYKKEFERRASLNSAPITNLPTLKPKVHRKSLIISPLLDKFSQEKNCDLKPVENGEKQTKHVIHTKDDYDVDNDSRFVEDNNNKRKKAAVSIISNAIEGNRRNSISKIGSLSASPPPSSRPFLSYGSRSLSLNNKKDDKKNEYPIEKTQSEDRKVLGKIVSSIPTTAKTSTAQSKERIIPIEIDRKPSRMASSSSSSPSPSTIVDNLKRNFSSQLRPPSVKSQLSPMQAPTTTNNLLTKNMQSKRTSATSVNESQPQSQTNNSELSSGGEPIRRSRREFIIPISIEGGGYVTPKQTSIDESNPSESFVDFSTTDHDHQFRSQIPSPFACRNHHQPQHFSSNLKHPDISDSNAFNLHRFRSMMKPSDENKLRFDKKHKLSSRDEIGDADKGTGIGNGNGNRDDDDDDDFDDDENFDLLTAENLFSTLLQRVRNLTEQMNSTNSLNKNSFHNNDHHDWMFQSSLLRKPNNDRNPYSSSTLPKDKKSENVLTNSKKLQILHELQSKLTDDELLTLLSPGLSRANQKKLLKNFLSKNLMSSSEKETVNGSRSQDNGCLSSNRMTSTSECDNETNNEALVKKPPPPTSKVSKKCDQTSEKSNEKQSKLPVLAKKCRPQEALDRENSISLTTEDVLQKKQQQQQQSLPQPQPQQRSPKSHRNSVCSTTFDDETTTTTTASIDSWSRCSSSDMLTAAANPLSSMSSSLQRRQQRQQSAATISRSTTPQLSDDSESISDRIRRKSFYTRFNEWKSPRKYSSPSPSSSASSSLNHNKSSSYYSTVPRRSFDTSFLLPSSSRIYGDSSALPASSLPMSSSSPLTRRCERSQSVSARSYSSHKPQSNRNNAAGTTNIGSNRYQVSPLTSRRPNSFFLPNYNLSSN